MPQQIRYVLKVGFTDKHSKLQTKTNQIYWLIKIKLHGEEFKVNLLTFE